MRADAVALTTRREGGPRVLQKTTKEDRESRVTALVLHGVVKAMGKGDRGGRRETVGDEAALKVQGET